MAGYKDLLYVSSNRNGFLSVVGYPALANASYSSNLIFKSYSVEPTSR